MLRAPALCGFGEGCQWQALPSPAQCEETTTRTQDLPVTGGKTLPLAPGPSFPATEGEHIVCAYGDSYKRKDKEKPSSRQATLRRW